ncbi:unnamed protein product [Staurois parvus]|uniref:Uncharacterized protein n=1 Tax=Staurois parvus TaxID=386267 RepID=A0ABN9DW51_9NEOB|nr:unnamed protein product [Staurois parvus]
MRGSQSTQCGDRRCAVSLGHSRSPIHGKSRRCRLGHVISCVQSQLITSAPPVSVHQCQLSVLIHATYQCPSELPFSVTHQCQSVPPISAANQCHISVQVSAA